MTNVVEDGVIRAMAYLAQAKTAFPYSPDFDAHITRALVAMSEWSVGTIADADKIEETP